MNYYERHLGDYAKDTGHLSMLEHGAYCLLLDRYYGTEQGIPEDQAHRIARAKSREERAAVDAVLAEFFVLVDGLWVNGRAEEEIVKARARIEAAKRNGRGGGRPRKNPDETQTKPSGLFVGSENETQTKAHQTPSTIYQTPVKKEAARGTRLSPDWKPSDDEWNFAAGLGMSEPEIQRTADNFRDYWTAKAGQNATKLDWTATWRGWVRRECERTPRPGASPAKPSVLRTRLDAIAASAGIGSSG